MCPGGYRVVAWVSGPLLPQAVRGSRFDGMMHVSDWYNTFASLAVRDTNRYATMQRCDTACNGKHRQGGVAV